LNHQFETFAPELSAAALTKALDGAGVAAAELDALLVCTCTGYLCPGVTSHLAEQLGCRPDIFLHDVVGLGCGAAIPTLRSAAAFLSANPGTTVATVAVEICSAAFYIDDDPGVLISLCLFGDAASASIWRGEGAAGQWRAYGWQTLHQPEHREKIRFVNAGGKLKNQLHRSVPALSAEAVSQLYASRPKSAADPRILAHTGGRDVVDAIEAKLELDGDDPLTETRKVLRDYGNCSSPCVMLALEQFLDGSRDDDRLWLTAFGAGFAAHACSLSRD
jgi:predicted naringenin-chalcone synthase